MAFSQVNGLLDRSLFISESLKNISAALSGKVQTEKSATSYLSEAVDLRQAFRELADGIQSNRSLAQLQKQKIEKTKVFFEGLAYYQTTLTNKIDESNVSLVDLNDYSGLQFEEIDWINDFSQNQAKVHEELQMKKQKKLKYQQKLTLKAERQLALKQKCEIYEKLMPLQVKKLRDCVIETGKSFNIVQMEEMEEIRSKYLSIVYDSLYPLAADKSLQLTHSIDEYESIEIVLNPLNFGLYEQAKSNKIDLREKTFKFVITSLEPLSKQLIVGVDRREDFSSEEVFQRLFLNEAIEKVFPRAENQFQRNMNTKYVYVPWLAKLSSIGALDAHHLMESIRERIFCLQLNTYLINNLKKLPFLFSLQTQDQSIDLNFCKKMQVSSIDKITFDEFLEKIQPPGWITKYLNAKTIAEEINSKKALEEKLYFDTINLNLILKRYKLQELDENNLNNYYVGKMTIKSGTIEFVIILPLNFPKSKSYIRFISVKGDVVEHKTYPKLPCKTTINDGGCVFTPEMSVIEGQLNEEIDHFYKGTMSHCFRLLLQINRMVCLLSTVNGG